MSETTDRAWDIVNQYLAAPSNDKGPGPQDVEAALAILRQEKQIGPEIRLLGNKLIEYDPAAADPKDRTRILVDGDGEGQSPEERTARLDLLRNQRDLTGAQATAARSNVKSPDERLADLEQTQAQTGLTRAQTANLETPDERMSRTIASQRAQAEALVQSKLALVAAGVELTETDREQFKILAVEHAAQLQALRDEQEFERNRPYKEAEMQRGTRELDISQRQAETSAETARQNAAFQEGQLGLQRQNAETQRLGEVRQQRKSVADPLLEQSRAGSNMLFEMAKGGTAPLPGASKALVFEPLNNALRILDAGERRGDFPKEWMPQPKLPMPEGYDPTLDAIRPVP